MAGSVFAVIHEPPLILLTVLLGIIGVAGWTFAPLLHKVFIRRSTMKFKRDRKIRNKPELTQLQRRLDSIASEINFLELSKITGGATVGYIVGVIGTAFMAGSVFAVTSATPNIALCIVLGIPGLAAWVLSYLLFRRISGAKMAQVTPVIDKKYDEIYEVCEKANHLLAS
ncbi:MAG: hypothetical protein LBN22_01265 [Clostridiales Family XIII bacterium]|jgi:Flp pilus assembly protein TadB|nr:hypothetical protein [Clostridiales Family XIII bacterium]